MFSNTDQTLKFFATASPGTEAVLAEELRELKFLHAREGHSGVRFSGDITEGWRACLHSRIAQRILLFLKQLDVQDARQLYDGVREVDWTTFLHCDQTLSVSVHGTSESFPHSGFTAQKIKDAVVDQLRDSAGRRPGVDREDPDVHIFVHLLGRRITLYLDLAGQPLHKRGYRKDAGEAPLRETLAAAMLRMANWDRDSMLIDPMCGSGTIAIEAALWAARIAPGLSRPVFGFERWACFSSENAETMRDLRGEARAQRGGATPRILASDQDAAVLEIAKLNARAAGVRIRLREAPLKEIHAPSGTFIVTNPPYGKRLEADASFLHELTTSLSRQHGTTVGLLAGSEEIAAALPFRCDKEFPVRNGDIACLFQVYRIP